MTNRDLAVVVVAAGLGTRLGADKPKAFVELGGKPLLWHALKNLHQIDALEQVIVAVPAGYESEANTIMNSALAGLGVIVNAVSGGDTRQQSIANALEFIDPEIEIVLVHDAARALAPNTLFNRVAAEVRRSGLGVVPVLKIADTVKRIDGEVVRETIDRNVLRIAQTPQGFKATDLLAAYASAKTEFTDDAALVQAHGIQVDAIEGDEVAFKITTAQDLVAAQLRLDALANSGDAKKLRTGIGTDVHRFSRNKNKPLYLGTLLLTNERGLDGHSDGDAVSHAIVDALLSAAGLGDIGSNFGVDRPEFAGANGKVFIEATLELLNAKGFAVRNVAVQIIGNRPKIAPIRALIENTLTQIVGAPVTIGATTTDGLGFLGNSKGVAAVATALIQSTEGRLAS